MKTLLYALLAVVLLSCVCAITCPDKDDHVEALKNVINDALTEELSQKADADNELVSLGAMIGTGIGGFALDNMLQVDNYFVCSVGRINYDGEKHTISIGILNHVFTPSRNDATSQPAAQ